MSILQNIGAGIAAIGLTIAGWFGYTPEPEYVPEPIQEEVLGADTMSFFGGQTYTLSGTGISSAATSFTLTSFTIPQNGKKIQDSEMSDTFYGTFEPGSRSRQEFFSCTTVTQNSDGTATISGCTRGLSPVAPYTASTSLQFAHSGGSSVIFSNTPQFYDQFTAKGNDEVITGQWTFSTFPITPSTTPASATTTGNVELATGLEAASSTPFGSSGQRLALNTLISTSSPNVAGNYVVVTKSDGFIGSEFFPTTTIRTYTATGTATWNKPQGLKFIKLQMWGGGGSGAYNATAGAELGGGGGGGYLELILASSSVSSTVIVNVGGGGAGVTTGNGNAGSSTSFGSYVVYGGGGGGQGTSGATGGGGGGAVATGTSLGVAGDTWGTGGGSTATPTPAYGGAGGGGASSAGVASGGGSAFWGGGGGGGSDGNGGPATTLGGSSVFGGRGGNGSNGGSGPTGGSQPGGGGGATRDGGTASGAGAPGQVIITEFF